MGKTTLLEKLIPALRARGLVVSLIKHSHKSIDIDRPGKDSYRLREAGCQEVLLLGNDRWALMHELRGEPEPDLDYLLDRLQHCDLVLVEGFKGGDFPKLEVWRSDLGRERLHPQLARHHRHGQRRCNCLRRPAGPGRYRSHCRLRAGKRPAAHLSAALPQYSRHPVNRVAAFLFHVFLDPY